MPADDELFPGLQAAKFLTDIDIEEHVLQGELIDKDHFDNDCLQGCSYDIRVGDKAILGGKGAQLDLTGENSLELEPGAYGGVISLEKVSLPRNTFARLGAKRKFSYDGLILLSGQTVDPGYSGHLVFGIYNASSKKRYIRRGDKICTIVFMLAGRMPKRSVSSDPNLSRGQFPPDFLKALDELDVLPYAELNERISQIKKVEDELSRLRQRVDDIFTPIKALTVSVEKLKDEVEENAKFVRQTSADVRDVTGSVKMLADRYTEVADQVRDVDKEVQSHKFRIKLLMIGIVIIWSIALILATVGISTLFGGSD